jgi:hypothetical protein
VPVHEMFEGQIVCQGHVEVFDRTQHPKAEGVCAESHREGNNDQNERFVTVL